MRTTLELDDELLAEASEYARKTGQPLRALVEEGLRRVLTNDGPQGGYRLPDRSVGDPAGDNPLEGYSPGETRDIAYGALDATTLLERWRHLPPADPDAWRRDIDSVVDPSL